MSKPKDMIGILEKKADDHLGQIDAFIEMFQSAQEEADDLDASATAEIARLNEVQKKCMRVISFTGKLLTTTTKEK